MHSPVRAVPGEGARAVVEPGLEGPVRTKGLARTRTIRIYSQRIPAMFQRFRQMLSSRPPAEGDGGAVAHWATGQFLQHRVLGPHQFDVSGRLHDRAFRAECLASSRFYINGLELRARVDLGLPPSGHVMVMSRVVRTALEAQADKIYQRSVDTAQTAAHELPEEVRWLSLFRSTQWKGVDERFWSRYAVLTDAPELAQRWLDSEALDYLMAGTSDAAAQVPVLAMLMRGRCYLRVQINPHAQGADALLALELLTHLSERALHLAARSGVLDGSLSSPG